MPLMPVISFGRRTQPRYATSCARAAGAAASSRAAITISTRRSMVGYHTPCMTAENYDVIVIGVGGMGSAACYHLARRNVRVLGLEQFDIPHNKGSSHGHTRMIRTAYFEHADYVPLLRRAWELWKRAESESLVQVLHQTGGLYLGPR